MHYVLGDIHNELQKVNSILKQIQLKNTDTLILLGDLFDRGGTNPDPVGLYFALSGLEA
jgi:predicted phosphodiesterase